MSRTAHAALALLLAAVSAAVLVDDLRHPDRAHAVVLAVLTGGQVANLSAFLRTPGSPR